MAEARLIALPSGKVAKVTMESVLVPEWLLEQKGEKGVDAIRDACEMACLTKAQELWGSEQTVTIRDISAADMSYTNNEFTDTSNASASAWNAMAEGTFTVPTATVIGIYGVSLGMVHSSTANTFRLPITGIRIDVGGARVAQWNVQTLDQYGTTGADSSVPYKAVAGVTWSPIVATEDITVVISEYTRTASIPYRPCWLGITVEKEGRTLKP